MQVIQASQTVAGERGELLGQLEQQINVYEDMLQI